MYTNLLSSLLQPINISAIMVEHNADKETIRKPIILSLTTCCNEYGMIVDVRVTMMPFRYTF